MPIWNYIIIVVELYSPRIAYKDIANHITHLHYEIPDPTIAYLLCVYQLQK